MNEILRLLIADDSALVALADRGSGTLDWIFGAAKEIILADYLAEDIAQKLFPDDHRPLRHREALREWLARSGHRISLQRTEDGEADRKAAACWAIAGNPPDLKPLRRSRIEFADLVDAVDKAHADGLDIVVLTNDIRYLRDIDYACGPGVTAISVDDLIELLGESTPPAAAGITNSDFDDAIMPEPCDRDAFAILLIDGGIGLHVRSLTGRLLILDSSSLIRLAMNDVDDLDCVFMAADEVWITDLLREDILSELFPSEVRDLHMRPQLQGWLRRNDHRIKIQATSSGDADRKAVACWERAGSPQELRPVRRADLGLIDILDALDRAKSATINLKLLTDHEDYANGRDYHDDLDVEILGVSEIKMIGHVMGLSVKPP